MARIPAEIWRFCVEQVKLYPLYEAQYFEELKNAETMYLHSDGDKTIDPTFQSLVGQLKTILGAEGVKELTEFQSLVGQLKTIAGAGLQTVRLGFNPSQVS